MFEMFLAICAMTALDCDSVYVRYGNPGLDNVAIAGIGESGAYHIVLDRDVRKKAKGTRRQILVHEIAHLVVFENDATNTTHNDDFQKVCRDLAKKVGLRSHKETCDSHTGPRSVWQSRRH